MRTFPAWLHLVGFSFYQVWVYAAFFTESPYLSAQLPDAVRYQVYIESLVLLCLSLVAIALFPAVVKGSNRKISTWIGALLMACSTAAMTVADQNNASALMALHASAAMSAIGTALVGVSWAVSFRKAARRALPAIFPIIFLEGLLILVVQLSAVAAMSALILFPALSALLALRSAQKGRSERSGEMLRPSFAQFTGYGLAWLLFGSSLGVLVGTTGDGSFRRLDDVAWLTVLAMTAMALLAIMRFIIPAGTLRDLMGSDANHPEGSDADHPEKKRLNSGDLLSLASFCFALLLCLFLPIVLSNFEGTVSRIQVGAASSIASFAIIELVTLLLFANAADVFHLPVPIVYGMGRAGRVLGVLAGSWLSSFAFGADSPFMLEQVKIVILVVACETIVVLTLLFAVWQSQKSTAQPPKAPTAPDFSSVCQTLALRYELSPREADVLLLLMKGRSQEKIQDELCIARSTASTHIHHVYQKLGVHSKQEVIDLAETTQEEQALKG